MPGELSNLGATNALAGAFGTATQTARTVYYALLTAAPTDATTLVTMTEYAATGYARPTAAQTAPGGDPVTIGNSTTLTIGPLTDANGTTAITHVALVSASSGTIGDFIAHWALNASRTPAAGDSISIAANGITLTLD